MKERLIEILQKSGASFENALPEEIAEYLIAEGVIVPPCKVGDTLYYPEFASGRVLLYKVISIKLNSKGLYVVCENYLSKSQMTHKATQIGKTVFLPREEAERALEEARK